jgi:hypothetical protein
LQGRFEHSHGRQSGVNYLGRLYNVVWFNDGYHAQHHAQPGCHWTRVREVALQEPPAQSVVPPLLRFVEDWLGAANRVQARALIGLEKWSMRHSWLLQELVLTHRRALAHLLKHADLPPRARIALVGGGLYPRTLLALAPLVPDAQITVIDSNAEHMHTAQAIARASGIDCSRVHWEHAAFSLASCPRFDLSIVPLGFSGDRTTLYRQARGALMIHDWAWRIRGQCGTAITWWLPKRINLVLPESHVAIARNSAAFDPAP